MLTALTNMVLRRTVRRWFEHDTDVQETRRKLDRFVGSTDAPPGGWGATDAGMAGGAALHLIGPRDAPAENAPLVLYFHGGGYIVGSLTGYLAFCARLAREVSGRVLFAEYRLAPEHPFPAAFEDGVAALQHAAGLAKGKLYIAGDSAGGGLALAVTQAAIAQGTRVPDGLMLICPWADLTLSGRSMTENAATDSMLSMKILIRMRGLYLNGEDPADRRASPLFDQNVHLPPVLLVYSTTEVLSSDSIRLALKLRGGGTQVTEVAVEGKPHVFPLFKIVPGAGKAVKAMGEFVTKAA